jgi:hypothetical protein
MIKSKQRAICHTAPYRYYFIDLLVLAVPSGDRAAREHLCARRRLQANRVAPRKGPSTNAASDILAKRTQCRPTRGRQLAHPKSSAASSWFGSADCQRLGMFENTAMRTPEGPPVRRIQPLPKGPELPGRSCTTPNPTCRVLATATLAALVEIDSPSQGVVALFAARLSATS